MPDGQPPPPLAPAFRSLPEYVRHWAETTPTAGRSPSSTIPRRTRGASTAR